MAYFDDDDDGMFPQPQPIQPRSAAARLIAQNGQFAPMPFQQDGLLPDNSGGDDASGGVVPVQPQPSKIQQPAQQPQQMAATMNNGQPGEVAPTGAVDSAGRPTLEIRPRQQPTLEAALTQPSDGLAPTSGKETSTADGLMPAPAGSLPADIASTPQQNQGAPSLAPQPYDVARQRADQLNALGPRPATNADLPAGQAHHGWRKALDVAAGIGMGAFTANPMAGVGVYQALNGAPLRRAQEAYDAKQAQAKQGFDTAAELEKENVGEGRVDAMKQHYEGMEDEREAKEDKMKEQFVAGTEQKDPKSPTGWTAQTVGGETKPFQPKRTKADEFHEEQGNYEQEADRLGLKGDDRKYYIANHKLKEPNPDQARIDEDRAERRQHTREHDQEMRNQHYEQSHARWSEHKAQIEKDQETGYAKIENEWSKKWGPQGQDVLDKRETDPQKQAAMADLASRKKLLEDSIQQRFHELGPEPGQPRQSDSEAEAAADNGKDEEGMDIAVPATTDSEGKPLAAIQKPVANVRSGQPVAQSTPAPVQQPPKPAPTPAPTPQPTPVQAAAKPSPSHKNQPMTLTPMSKQHVQMNQQVTVGGKTKYVLGVNPKTGKVIVSDHPQGQ